MSSKKLPTEVPVNFQMVEMLYSGHVPPEMVHPDLLASVGNANRPTTDPIVAKRSVVEIFKVRYWHRADGLLIPASQITINFLQVVAAAVYINTNWTDWMHNLLSTAGTSLCRRWMDASFVLSLDFLGGAATDGIVLSVDCLFAADHHPPRSILRSVIHFAVPLGITAFYIVLWTILTIRLNRGRAYFAKRALLSAMAMAYLAYLPITKTAANALYCVDVPDSIDAENDHTVRYWAVDTSLKCYEGSHAVLAAVIGWPVILLISFGMPLILAGFLIKQNTTEQTEESWTAEATGFLYRAYKERFIFWESIVMLRKSVLAVIVVFSYPLGVNIQGILAISLLSLAIYIHVCCQPFKDDFAFLNALETSSLVVSQLTFACGLFFNDHRTSEAIRILLSIALSIAICGLFLIFVYKLLRCSEMYIKAVLESEGMEDVQEWGMLSVLRMFLMMHLAVLYHRLIRKRHTNRSSSREQPGTSTGI